MIRKFESAGEVKAFVKRASTTAITDWIQSIYNAGYQRALEDLRAAQQEHAKQQLLEDQTDEFLEENKELMDKLAEIENEQDSVVTAQEEDTTGADAGDRPVVGSSVAE